VFVDEFEEKIKSVVDELKEITDWDLVYFGGSPEPFFKHRTYPCVNASEHLCTIDSMWCIHAAAIHSRFFDKVLTSNPVHIYPMDLFYIHFPSDQRKYLMTKELLVIQDDDSVSDVSGQLMPRNELFKENYKKVIG
jgi:hypothetical protein